MKFRKKYKILTKKNIEDSQILNSCKLFFYVEIQNSRNKEVYEFNTDFSQTTNRPKQLIAHMSAQRPMPPSLTAIEQFMPHVLVIDIHSICYQFTGVYTSICPSSYHPYKLKITKMDYKQHIFPPDTYSLIFEYARIVKS